MNSAITIGVIKPENSGGDGGNLQAKNILEFVGVTGAPQVYPLDPITTVQAVFINKAICYQDDYEDDGETLTILPPTVIVDGDIISIISCVEPE